VIVESPAKAKTINKYLGADYVVQASIGHVRDLPAKAPKGSKQPVPGVDLENRFEPTYEVMPDKKKTVTDLKRLAREASEVWFATDLDREGEAIAWHLAQELGIEPRRAKRVVFNAITKDEIQRAFSNPHPIDVDRVNAQQARRILDRIVGYQVSPLLWRKVARGLSAGRVQSVAVRLIVEREREIRAFVPEEYWQVTANLAVDPAKAPSLTDALARFLAGRDERGKGPTQKAIGEWIASHGAFSAELVELGGEKFELTSADQTDLAPRAAEVAKAVGLIDVNTTVQEDPAGRGPSKFVRTVTGRIDPAARYAVRDLETKRTTTRPQAPFITSTLQMAASSFLSFGAQRTMRAAQALYEGVNVPGEGQVGLITYMRTDSVHISGEALTSVREFIGREYGARYLPEKPNFFSGSNKDAQEAHEAIRPTDVSRHPDQVAGSLTEDQAKLYRLIWRRFVSCQMTPAEWDSTTIHLQRSDKPTGAVLRSTGRVLVFDGFYKATGIPAGGDEQTLPALKPQQAVAPISIDPVQCFTAPPKRYSEASLIKTLEAEGIGRPSTYASIIQVIQDREYVRVLDRAFHATDLGEVVTDKLIEAFPDLMSVTYTREMELELDEVAERQRDWRSMLQGFYDPFTKSLQSAMEGMKHAKAEVVAAPYKCPQCGRRTAFRFGRNGRFLSCSGFPECTFASPIDAQGRPITTERVNVACPEDGSAMVLRTGRFGKFLASVNYPEVKFVINLDRKGGIKYPAQPPVLSDLPCPKCEAPLNVRRGKRGPWLGCSKFPKCRGREAWTKLEEAKQKALAAKLEENDRAHPPVVIRTLDGKVIPEGTPVKDLIIGAGTVELERHPDAEREFAA